MPQVIPMVVAYGVQAMTVGYIGAVAAGIAGAVAGGLVASAMTPKQRSEGPRLGDARVQSSAYGTAIPYVLSSPRVAGQVIFASDIREIKTVTEGGKGGGSESTSYTYEVDLLLLLTDNIIAGVRRIWWNGKLVWTQASDAPAGSVSASEGTSLWTRLTVYTGDPAQLPDPTYEAAVGSANAPAYRGRGTVFIEGLQLGNSGQIPNLTFEVNTAAGLPSDVLTAGAINNLGSTIGIAFVHASIRQDSHRSVNETSLLLIRNSLGFGSQHTTLIGTVSGDTISLGVGATIDPADTSGANTYVISKHSEDKFVFTYYNSSTNYHGAVGISTNSTAAVPTATAAIYDTSTSSYPNYSCMIMPGITLIATQSGASGRPEFLIADGYGPFTYGAPLILSAMAFESIPGLPTRLSDTTAICFLSTNTITKNLVHLTIGGTNVTAGTLLDVSAIAYPAWTSLVLYRMTDSKALAVYTKSTGMYARFIAVSGTSLSLGAEITVHTTAAVATFSIELASGNRYVCSFTYSTGNNIYAMVLDIDDVAETITSGPPLLIEANVNIMSNTSVQRLSDSRMSLVYQNTTATEVHGVILHVPLAGATFSNMTITVAEAITALMLRMGYTAGQFDVTGLASVTQPVRSLIVSQITSGRSVIDMIRNTYFVDCVVSDKIYFFKMGGASVATIPYADLGADGGKPLVIIDADELEVYAQYSLTYYNIDNDHQEDVQLSDRLLTGQESMSANSVPMDFIAQEAKVIVDTQLLLQAIGMRRATIAVGRKYYYVQAGDPITVIGEDGSSYRFRVAKIAMSGGIYKWEVVIDDESCYLQAGITTPAATGQTTVNPVPNTTLYPLDPPLLIESNDEPGYYAAVEGTADNWRSGAVLDSTDNVSFTSRAVYSDEAVMGTASTVLGNWTGGNVVDITNTLTVDIGETGALGSATFVSLGLSLSTNLLMVGSELIQFITATLTAPGIYVLSGLLRGRRGTESHIGTHVASERVTLITPSGLRFITLQTAEIGRLRYLKAVSSGQRVESVSSQEFRPLGVALKPFAPINFRANRATTDTVLRWERRTRFSYRITGQLAWSCPLGETIESYAIEIYSSNTYLTLKRTLTSATNSVTYTSAHQVTDFGSNQTIIYAKVYQVSSVIGNGYPLTASS